MTRTSNDRRVVLVTGGGTGIGKAIATAFAAANDQVVICGRTPAALESAAAEIGGEVAIKRCDVGEHSSVQALAKEVVAEFGGVDVLINNAGVYGPIGVAHENDVQAWVDAIRINLTSVFLMTGEFAPLIAKRGGGSIINLSGGGATAPKPHYSSYAASKAGVVRFTETTALELADQNINVNAIAPGFIVTRFHDETMAAGDGAGPELAATAKKLDQGGDDPAKAGGLAVYLASAKARDITGKLISAVFDEWGSDELHDQLVASKDLYTLRRIDRFMFQEVPK